ncbi:MAG: tetratricopeptide repeat protein [Hormoscilla sp. GUM202]|nr:tetratricopeptide repeat protein [Hormoscilla sp. GUM202]
MVQQADNDRLREALSHYKAGRLNEARAVYLAMLKQQPHQVEAMLLLGIIAYQTQEYDRALGYFQQVISIKPDWPETYNNLGACFWEQGKIEQAIAAYKQAIAVKPDYHDAYKNLALALEKQGKRLELRETHQRGGSPHQSGTAPEKLEKRYQEALAHYQQAISWYQKGKKDKAIALCRQALLAHPGHSKTVNLLGVCLQNTGKPAEAVSVYREAIALNPQDMSLHNNLGVVLCSLGHKEQALACYEKAITIDQNCADAYYNAAKIMEEQNRRKEAMAYCKKAIAIKPKAEFYNQLGIYYQGCENLAEAIAYCKKAIAIKPKAEFYNQLGIYYQGCENLAEAAKQCEQAIALKPNYPEAICNLGMILQEQGKIAEAIGQYRQALAIKPDYPGAYDKMGTALQEQGKLAEAIACHQKAIALKPDFAEAYNNLGLALQEQLKLQEAIGYYRHAIALNPDAAMAHLNLGMCLLLQDFQQGFVEYEWRWRLVPETPEERLGKSLWDGSPLAGKTILLHTEQGYGDAIQFVRYAPLVAQRGAGKVILETNRALRRLFTTAPGVQEVVVKGEPLPAFDLQVPLMSLPRILNTTIETIPDRIPYLYAEEKEAVKYSELVRTEGEVKVGIVWSPSDKAPKKRFCPVSLFLELSQIPGISLYSLQKEHTDILDGAPIQDLRELLHDFADTAAVISQLDLVISVDTAVAHLAGALGKPVWVLLPFSPDWRWLLDRSSSPWYPTMRLFRQQQPGDWSELFARVKSALLSWSGEWSVMIRK